MRNLRRLLGDATDDMAEAAPAAVRMQRAPVAIQGEGEDVSTDELPPVTIRGTGEDRDELAPVAIYPNGDPRADLAPVEGGYPADWGLDLREPSQKRPAPAVAASDAEVPDDMKGVLAGLGGVADRAQAAMEAPSGAGGSRLAGFMGQAAQSAAMGAGGGPLRAALIPPEVREFVQAKAQPEGSEYERAKKQGDLERSLSGMAGNVHAGLDIATRMKTPGYGNGMAEGADRREADAKDRDAKVREFARAKVAGERQKGLDDLDRRVKESQIEKNAREGQPKATAPKERDPLADEKTRAEIERIKAETARTQHRGAGGSSGPSLDDQKKQLDIERMRREASGEDPKKVALADASKVKLKGLIGQLRELHRVNGTELVGDTATNMRQLMRQIQVEAKNVADLGALSGPDMALMEDITGSDPTSLWSNVKAAATGGYMDGTKSSLDQLEKWADNSVQAARTAYGPKNDASSASAETVLMISPDGKQRRVPKARVQAALAAGGKLAE